MKAKTASSETAVLAAERKLHNTWVYIKRHWQLYLLFLLPAVVPVSYTHLTLPTN